VRLAAADEHRAHTKQAYAAYKERAAAARVGFNTAKAEGTRLAYTRGLVRYFSETEDAWNRYVADLRRIGTDRIANRMDRRARLEARARRWLAKLEARNAG
jgi:hypothetical protein